MAPAVEVFFARGAGPRMMNIVLSGQNGEAEAHFKVPGHRKVGERRPAALLAGDRRRRRLLGGILASADPRRAEQAHPADGRRLSRGDGSCAQADARGRARLRRSQSCCRHIRPQHGFALGHLSGHSIGTTMIEHPAIGAKSQIELKQNMIFSLHPQVVDRDGEVCLYTQDTFRVGQTEGENLSTIPWKFYSQPEVRQAREISQ